MIYKEKITQKFQKLSNLIEFFQNLLILPIFCRFFSKILLYSRLTVFYQLEIVQLVFGAVFFGFMEFIWSLPDKKHKNLNTSRGL